jgi:co-chaperonin GroES (HSP10)
MFKKPEQIKPLPPGMTEAFSKTLTRQGFVAPVQQPAPQPKSLVEGKMSEIDDALRSMSDQDFKTHYKMTKAEMRLKLKGKSVNEAHEGGMCKCDDAEYNSKGMCKTCGMPEDEEDMSESSHDHESMARSIEQYISKHYNGKSGLDTKDFMKAAGMVRKGDMTGARKLASTLDTDPRDKLLGMLKHDMDEAQDPKAEKYPLVSRVDKAVDKNGKVDPSDKYLSVRRQAVARTLATNVVSEDALHPDAHKVLKHIKPEHQAKYKPDLTKKHYTGNYADRSAVLKAAQSAGHLNEDTLHPDAHKVLKHIKPEHHAKYTPDLTKKHYTGSYGDRSSVLKAAQSAGHLKEASYEDMEDSAKDKKQDKAGMKRTGMTAKQYEKSKEDKKEDDEKLDENWDAMLKSVKDRSQPQPNGGAGKKQGTAYGGSKQKDAPSPKKEELSPAQKAIDKNKNGKIDGFDLAALRNKKKPQGAEFAAARRKERMDKNGRMDEEVKVGDKVSFDHPMSAIPGKTMKKIGTVKKIEGDTAHLKSSTKYGTLSYQKKVSELRKEEVESIQELSNTTLKSYTDKSTKSATDNMAKADKHAELAAGAQKTGSIPLARINNRIADKAQAQANKRVAGMIKAVVKMKSEEVDLEEGKYSDDDWVIMKSGGTMDNPTKDTIVGYRKAGKGAFSAPKTEPGQKAMRISVAKKKGYTISVTEETAELTEAPNYALYHTTFSAAVQEAIAVAKKQGFEVDEEDWQNKVATGPKKPSKDKTNSYTINLTKDGSPVKKKLHIQVYNMGPKYELNTYVQ